MSGESSEARKRASPGDLLRRAHPPKRVPLHHGLFHPPGVEALTEDALGQGHVDGARAYAVHSGPVLGQVDERMGSGLEISASLSRLAGANHLAYRRVGRPEVIRNLSQRLPMVYVGLMDDSVAIRFGDRPPPLRAPRGGASLPQDPERPRRSCRWRRRPRQPRRAGRSGPRRGLSYGRQFPVASNLPIRFPLRIWW